jgi:redox-sensitive bicupin YhaK (pirin superfamily)
LIGTEAVVIQVRRSDERGRADFGWLDSRHTFSFGGYHDPEHMGFRALRVINEDRVRPGAGFGAHGHRDMEIVSYVLSGNLAHKDSMGNGSVLTPGDVQRMTAGTGVQHSEMNPSLDEPLHFLQIWILPERVGLEPGYEETNVSDEDKRGRWRLLASGRADNGAMKIHQDVDVYATVCDANRGARLELRPGRYAWVQVVRGEASLNGHEVAAGDGVAVSDERAIELNAKTETELLLFDLA